MYFKDSILRWILWLVVAQTSYVWSEQKYFNKTFGHIHVKPYPYSSSQTGISCGELLNLNTAENNIEKNWQAVTFGDKKGYVYQTLLSATKPDCLQAAYPVFFQSLELDLTEIFLWGKLNDQFIEFETGK